MTQIGQLRTFGAFRNLFKTDISRYSNCEENPYAFGSDDNSTYRSTTWLSRRYSTNCVWQCS
ncbi:hypothetical protein CAter282_1705 [Collimonas arenae]|uniref:Uncharacterized protein n=1 Tax=Collimonas arenae TaxID=279058 RepID=A0A127QHL5_9BURK|nr:hypothetical protein CAter10_1838 [Collimonas arenae]AMP09486.1 hypothetical protein CAter282_1705 [Collimonas arenae]